MRKEEFFEVFGDVDDDIVKGTMKPVKKRIRWKTWTVMAACLCFMAVGTIILSKQNVITHEGVNTPGNGDEGGAEGTYSVAVYPSMESEENVETATVVSITEGEALAHTLAEYLPRQLPEGFHYGRGSHYETIMKDGTQYNMLRIEYITGTIPVQQFTEDGGAIAPDLESIGSQFLIMVWDHEPGTDRKIYTPEDVTLQLLENESVVYIRYDNVYVGVSAETAEAKAVLEAVKSICRYSGS